MLKNMQKSAKMLKNAQKNVKKMWKKCGKIRQKCEKMWKMWKIEKTRFRISERYRMWCFRVAFSWVNLHPIRGCFIFFFLRKHQLVTQASKTRSQKKSAGVPGFVFCEKGLEIWNMKFCTDLLRLDCRGHRWVLTFSTKKLCGIFSVFFTFFFAFLKKHCYPIFGALSPIFSRFEFSFTFFRIFSGSQFLQLFFVDKKMLTVKFMLHIIARN